MVRELWTVTVDRAPWHATVTTYDDRDEAMKHAIKSLLDWLPAPVKYAPMFRPFLDLVIASRWEDAWNAGEAALANVYGSKPKIAVIKLEPRSSGYYDDEWLIFKAQKLRGGRSQ